MITLIIDNKEIRVIPGTTILAAAKSSGIDIPTMCYIEDLGPLTSCMVCVVEVQGSQFLVPSCTAMAEEGMIIETNNNRVRDARKTAIELLLSEHAGDCIAPCQKACPFHINIPMMIRLIQKRDFNAAREIISKASSNVNNKCNKQCEKACRRRLIDEPVGISNLVKFLHNHINSTDKIETNKNTKCCLNDNFSNKHISNTNIFSSIMKKITKEECDILVSNSSKEKRVQPKNLIKGYNQAEALNESLRCLHCDCRKKNSCKLREHAEVFQAKQSRFSGERIRFSQLVFRDYIFEQGKCIKCGICTRISEKKRIKYGFSFLKRGFDTRVGVPFNKYENPELNGIMSSIIMNCPTGALAYNESQE